MGGCFFIPGSSAFSEKYVALLSELWPSSQK